MLLSSVLSLVNLMLLFALALAPVNPHVLDGHGVVDVVWLARMPERYSGWY
jgi:hypothetical protein